MAQVGTIERRPPEGHPRRVGEDETDPIIGSLLTKPLDHRLREIDPIDMETSRGKREREQTGADTDLQNAVAPSQLMGEKICRHTQRVRR